MTRRLLGISMLLTCAALALAPVAAALPRLRGRIGGALGIVPPPGHPTTAVGVNLPEVYHGGAVMHDVTIHTIFWATRGFAFEAAPSGASQGYEPLIQQFFTDAAHDSGETSNVFSVLSEYADRSGPGRYSLHYAAAADSIDVTDRYPAPADQCASPSGVPTCVTDLELQREIDRVIQAHDPGARGLGNIWLVFLPPDVDTCITPSACGTNAFGGYHALSNLGHGPTVYASVPDPLIETTSGPGSDPQGNPDAESAIDVAAHESVEAITDPRGEGWMDSNGNEVADKCDSAPEHARPLGFAANGSPFNQIINGHDYLLQTMWSNVARGCVQRSSATTPYVPLAQVYLTQFDSHVSGRIGIARPGLRVSVTLLRTGVGIAHAAAITSADGGWGPVALLSGDGIRHAVGDDRDEIDVTYGPGGPREDVILTGDGGNPFTESGWTGWFDLDHGFAVASGSSRGAVTLAPCSQTGVLGLTIDRNPAQSPTDTCETETDAATLRTGPLAARRVLRMSSNDNRAVTPLNPAGALVSLTVPLGEPNSVTSVGNRLVQIEPTGFPTCIGDVHDGVVRCSGLVPAADYALTRTRGGRAARARADASGSIRVRFSGRSPGLSGGDLLRLTNSAGRTLILLHLARLRVHIDGSQTTVASGTCEPGDYYGHPLRSPPLSAGVGLGIDGAGTICPPSGNAKGLPAGDIEQTDDLSGAQTRTEVPLIADTSPTQDETIYGRFVALAGAGAPGAGKSPIASRDPVAMTITPATGARPVFQAGNVNTAHGVAVPALGAGIYLARWVLRDANGDTRVLRTRFLVGYGAGPHASAAASVRRAPGASGP